MAKVEIYTTTVCPYCVRAKNLLKSKGVAYDEISAEDDAVRVKMMERAAGRRSVPQIFIDGTGIGGADDLAKLDKEGKLNAMLGLA
jgi:glutaredoxin 3